MDGLGMGALEMGDLGMPGMEVAGSGLHSWMLAIAIAVAFLGRSGWGRFLKLEGLGWRSRWRWAMGAFVVPPLLLANSALAVLLMGRHCPMVGPWSGIASHVIAVAVLGGAIALVSWCAWLQRRDLMRVRAFPEVTVFGDRVRVAPVARPYAAALGGWRAEVLVTAGAIAQLAPETLAAVLAHERAHVTCRDPFLFFWLGGLRRLTRWLPHTDALWRELTLLRELRADRLAAATVDPLTLAEALLTLARSDRWTPDPLTAIGILDGRNLTERVDALLALDPHRLPSRDRLDWSGWLSGGAIALLPFLSLIHHQG